MSLVEKCWMITSNVSVIAVLIITGICFGIFVRPYMKKKKEAIAVSTVYIAVMLVLYIVPPQIDNFSAYMMGIMAAFIVMYAEDRRNIYQGMATLRTICRNQNFKSNFLHCFYSRWGMAD